MVACGAQRGESGGRGDAERRLPSPTHAALLSHNTEVVEERRGSIGIMVGQEVRRLAAQVGG